MRATVDRLSADDFQGRRIGTLGGQRTAEWLAGQLADLGASVRIDAAHGDGRWVLAEAYQPDALAAAHVAGAIGVILPRDADAAARPVIACAHELVADARRRATP